MKKKILVVDDEKDILDILEAILSNAGYDVIKALGGREAVSIAKKERPDLIILDIKMPDMDGGQTTDVLKNYRQTRDIPIIYLSSLVNKTELEKDGYVLGSKIGDMHFVPKSASPGELVEIVKKSIG